MKNQFPKSQRWSLCLLLFALVALPLAGCTATEPEEDTAVEPMETTGTAMNTEEPGMMGGNEQATAELMNADGESVGTVHFTSENGQVHVVAALHDVEGAGMHGFHVHETGECTAPDFKSAGGHFNPADVEHACPPTTPRHAGDMGNVEVGDDGSASFDYSSADISLGGGQSSIVGKAVVLHAGEDDCTSQPSGDAGARLACGVISMDGMGMDGGMGMDEGTMDGGMGMDDDMDQGGGMANDNG